MGLVFIPLFLLCLARSHTVFSYEVKKKTNTTPIEHVIVLMLENRSFDHMLGFLKKANPDIRGCLPNEEKCSNPKDPADPNSDTVTVQDTAVYVQVSPSHSIEGTTVELYGTNVADVTKDAPMNGFVKSYTGTTGSVEEGEGIMKCFSTEHLPVLSQLATEFTVFDSWHASVPGPTMPNRAFFASGSSHGMGINDKITIAKGMPQKTMFRQIQEMGLDYRVYFELVPTMLMFKDMRHKDARPRYHHLDQLYEDLKTGDLPELSFVEPSYYTTPKTPADDQHPDHDVGLGEQLIANIYNLLRASPAWNSTAFIITYDEHGGFFDHVSPMVNIPNPDGFNFTDNNGNVLFDFTRGGVRVPTVVVSPWVEKGQVIHDPIDTTKRYEHSSMISTVVHKLFRPAFGHPEPSYLNKRDSWAPTFEHIFQILSEPRTDCPSKANNVVLQSTLTPDVLSKQDGSARLNDLQTEILSIVAGATEDDKYDHDDITITNWTELSAAEYIAKRLNLFFEREIVRI